MSTLRERIEGGFEDWARWVIRWRWPAIVLMLGLTLVPASQIPRVQIDTSPQGFLHEDDPTRVSYDVFRDRFGSDEVLLVAVETEEIFDLEFLDRLRRLHHDLERSVPHLERVRSLINARSVRGDGPRLIVGGLLADPPRTDADLRALREHVRGNPLYENLLLSADARFTILMIEFEAGGASASDEGVLSGFDDLGAGRSRVPRRGELLSGHENSRAVEAVGEVAARHRAPGFRIHLAGMPVMAHRLQEDIRRDLTRFMLLAVFLIGLLLFLLFRRVLGVVLPLGVVGLSIASTIGLIGFLDESITPATQILPSFLLAVGVGYSVHILAIFFQRIRQGAAREEAIVFALGHSGLAVGMTALTTAGGLISFAAAEVAPVAAFGIFAPMGVALTLAYTLVLLPAVVAVVPLSDAPRVSRDAGLAALSRGLVAAGDIAIRHPWKVLAATALVAAASLGGVSRLHFAHDPLTWLPEDEELRKATRLIDRELRGTVNFEAVIQTGRENALHEPDLLELLDEMRRYAEGYREGELFVGKTLSLLEIIKETHQALNENRPDHYAIPADRALIAQELLLFEASGIDDLERFTDSAFTTGRMTLKLPWADATEVAPFISHLEERFREILGPHAELGVTGFAAVMARTLNAITRSLVKSYAIALAIITPLMMLLIGSIRRGLVSMVPNLAPVLLTLGLMGWCGLPLDAFTILIGCIAIGLAVDDTIHFIHGFRRYYDESGNSAYAVRRTLETTGQALLFTSLVLSTGFFIFMLSSMQNLYIFGLLTGFTIVTAFIADVLVAPALLVLVTRYEDRGVLELIFHGRSLR